MLSWRPGEFPRRDGKSVQREPPPSPLEPAAKLGAIDERRLTIKFVNKVGSWRSLPCLQRRLKAGVRSGRLSRVSRQSNRPRQPRIRRVFTLTMSSSPRIAAHPERPGGDKSPEGRSFAGHRSKRRLGRLFAPGRRHGEKRLARETGRWSRHSQRRTMLSTRSRPGPTGNGTIRHGGPPRARISPNNHSSTRSPR